jgi:hypothetical protein
MPQGPQRRTLSEAEFNGIRDRLLSQAPEGLKPDAFERWATSRMHQAVAEAEYSPAPVEGSAGGRFMSNLAEGLNPQAIVQGLWRAGTHPVETAKTMLGAQAGEFEKSKALAGEGRYTEAGGHGLAAALPLVGPMAAQAGEQMATGDVAGGFGSATSLLAPMAIPSAIRGGARAVRGLSPAGTAESVAGSLEQGAANRFQRVTAPQVGANKTRFGNMAESVSGDLARAEGTGAWTREGLHDVVQQRLVTAEQALDAAADARLASRPVPVRPIVEALLEQRRALTSEAVEGSRTVPGMSGAGGRPMPVGTTQNVQSGRMQPRLDKVARPIGEDVVPGPNAARVAVIDQAIAELQKLGPVAHYEPLRRMRAAYDGPAKAVYSPSVTADFLKAQGGKLGAADVTGTLRRVLAGADETTAGANAEYSLWRTANDVMEATREVERTRPRVGRAIMTRLTTTLAGGQAGGVPGAAAGFVLAPAIDAAMGSGITVQLKTAKLMQALATAIRQGNIEAISGLTGKLRSAQASSIVGRTTSPSESQPSPTGSMQPAWR